MGLVKNMSKRMGITLLLLVLQIILLSTLVIAIFIRFPVVALVGIVFSFLVFLYVLKKTEASAYKLMWIIIILLLPPIGGVIYLLFGKEHYVRKLVVDHVNEHALIAKLLNNDGNLPFLNQVQCGRMFSLMKYIRQSSSYHAYINTETKYYPFGEIMFEDMLAAIAKAEKFIFLEFFIIYKGKMWDALLEALLRKAEEGVEIRLTVDDFGAQKLFTNAYIAMLQAKKIRVLRFNPMIPLLFSFMNHRNHRKIVVVDGHTAFSGGLNIADEYINQNDRLGVWKDTGVRLKGDAVWSFTLMFIETWDTFCKAEERIIDHSLYKHATDENIPTDGFVLPYGDSPLDHDRLGENIYIDMLNQAEYYTYIFTPYLIISEKMIHALQMTAKRGVDVRIVTPGIPDKKLIFRLTRSFYNCLLEAGVRIYEYTPGFLHAKNFVCDDKIAVVGTINLDYRSLYLHFECATLLYNVSVIENIKEDALKTINESHEIIQTKKRRKIREDLLDSFLHLFAPLL